MTECPRIDDEARRFSINGYDVISDGNSTNMCDREVEFGGLRPDRINRLKEKMLDVLEISRDGDLVGYIGIEEMLRFKQRGNMAYSRIHMVPVKDYDEQLLNTMVYIGEALSAIHKFSDMLLYVPIGKPDIGKFLGSIGYRHRFRGVWGRKPWRLQRSRQNRKP